MILYSRPPLTFHQDLHKIERPPIGVSIMGTKEWDNIPGSIAQEETDKSEHRT